MVNDTITYVFTFRIEADATSFDYWGRDDETKQILLGPAGAHNFEGKIQVEVIREADMYLDFEGDDGFEKATMQKSGRLMKQCLFMAVDIAKLHNNVIMRNSKSMLLSWKNTWKKSKSVEKIATVTRKQTIQPLLCESRQTTWAMTSCFQLIMYRSVLQMNILLLLM